MKKRLSIFSLCITQVALASPSPAEFHRAVYALHEQQLAKYTIRTEERTGEYEGSAAAGFRYRTTSYYDAKTGRLLSRVERNADRPEAVHIAEVNIHDGDGNLVRGFISISLPWAPLHPVRTWINLHHRNGKLESLRQFNLQGQVNYEFCEGELDGKHVRISLDESDINPSATGSPAYQACFDGVGRNWEQYATPH